MKSKAINKILTLGLAVALVFCGLPMTAGAVDIEMANTNDWSWVKVNKDKDTTTKVWFGADTHGEPDPAKWTPYCWYVIGLNGSGVASETGTMTLLAVDPMGGNDMFNPSSNAVNTYKDSKLYNELNGWRLANIPKREQALMKPRDLEGGSGSFSCYDYKGITDGLPAADVANGADTNTYTGNYSYVSNNATFDWYDYHTQRTATTGSIGSEAYTGTYHPDKVAGDEVTGVKLWPLSLAEASLVDPAIRQCSDSWWLRSPGSKNSIAAVVLDDGSVNAGGITVSGARAIRPAFYLDLSSVIFTSAASGGKGGAVGDPLEQATAPNGAVKLTVESSGQKLDVVTDTAGKTQSGATLEFGYRNATTGQNQYVSCVLEENDEVKYYGKLANCTTDSSGTLSVPLTNVVDGTYTLKVFNDQVNGNNLTDFCSTPVTMTVEVDNKIGTVSDFKGTVDDGTPPPTPAPTPAPPTQTTEQTTRRRSSGSGQTYSPPAAAIPQPFVVDATKAKSALEEKGKSGAAKARIRHNGEIKVLAEAWKAFGKTPVDFDTADENGVQVRVTIPEPGKMAGDKLLSGYIKGSAAENRKAHFEKWFTNKLRVIHLDQTEPWGQPVEIAAKLDLTGMDAGNLYFYSYDSKTNKYKRIENPAYRIDENGFLHFTTEYAGDIIVSDGPLERV